MMLADTDVEFLRSLVVRRSGNMLTSGHRYLLETRLTPLAANAGLPDIQSLVAELKRIPAKYEDIVVEAMTNNETSFFRDDQLFETLRTDVLPVIVSARNGTRELSIWSAASSSGQEAYSIAMTLREHFPQLDAWNVGILATDISDEMLRRTRNGTYSPFEVSRGLPANLLGKYFTKCGERWQANQSLRCVVHSEKVNLTEAWPARAQFDVVFLRNVLIYFDPAMRTRILNRMHKAIRPDGYLFLGGGETLLPLNVPFLRESVGKTVCFRPVAV